MQNASEHNITFTPTITSSPQIQQADPTHISATRVDQSQSAPTFSTMHTNTRNLFDEIMDVGDPLALANQSNRTQPTPMEANQSQDLITFSPKNVTSQSNNAQDFTPPSSPYVPTTPPPQLPQIQTAQTSSHFHTSTSPYVPRTPPPQLPQNQSAQTSSLINSFIPPTPPTIQRTPILTPEIRNPNTNSIVSNFTPPSPYKQKPVTPINNAKDFPPPPSPYVPTTPPPQLPRNKAVSKKKYQVERNTPPKTRSQAKPGDQPVWEPWMSAHDYFQALARAYKTEAIAKPVSTLPFTPPPPPPYKRSRPDSPTSARIDQTSLVVFKCDICHLTFKTKGGYKRHRERKHNITSDDASLNPLTISQIDENKRRKIDHFPKWS